MSLSRARLWLWLGWAFAAPPAYAGVESTVHNLSVSGPGEIKSTTESEICVFCHEVHVPAAQQPLWNRELPAARNYRVYKSATMRAQTPQPDGASKLCLSCHDGTIALGKLLSRKAPVGMRGVGGRGEIPGSRASNLGTDLSGSHPVSIAHDTGVTRARGREQGIIGIETGLVSRPLVPPDLLDKSGKVQCTTCHDPHENRYAASGVPGFWRRPTVSEVCVSCHTW